MRGVFGLDGVVGVVGVVFLNQNFGLDGVVDSLMTILLDFLALKTVPTAPYLGG